MLIDVTLSVQQYMQKFLHVWDSHIYFKLHVWITKARTFCPLSKKHIVSPVFGNYTIYFVFWKKFSQVKKSFQFLIDFIYEALWRPYFIINRQNRLRFWKKVNLPYSNHLVPSLYFQCDANLLFCQPLSVFSDILWTPALRILKKETWKNYPGPYLRIQVTHILHGTQH